jgi:hypothetical protein
MSVRMHNSSNIESIFTRLQRANATSATALQPNAEQDSQRKLEQQRLESIEQDAYLSGTARANEELAELKRDLEEQAEREREARKKLDREVTNQLTDALKQIRSKSVEMTMLAEELAVELAYESVVNILGQAIPLDVLKNALLQRAIDALAGNPTCLRAGAFFGDLEPPKGISLTIDKQLSPTQLVLESPKGNQTTDLKARLHALADGFVRELSV